MLLFDCCLSKIRDDLLANKAEEIRTKVEARGLERNQRYKPDSDWSKVIKQVARVFGVQEPADQLREKKINARSTSQRQKRPD